jgi:hypothetical protein
MDIAKSKDGLKAQRDVEQLHVMPELHPVLETKTEKYTLPAASYNLDLEERRGYALL